MSAQAWRRLAVLSDIHGNLPALEAVIAEIATEHVDVVLNLGDIASGPLWPAETVQRLMALEWPTLAGNHERQLLTLKRARQGPSDAFAADRLNDAQRGWLAALPTTLAWPQQDMAACHGTPASDLQYLLETVTPGLEAQGHPGIRAATPAELAERLGGLPATWPGLLLCGHSHVPRAVAWGGTLIVNPGSVGLQAYDDDHPHAHRVENHSPHARWALLERTADGWRVQLRATPYDHEAAARRAEAGLRGDWADALRTGRVGRLEKDLNA